MAESVFIDQSLSKSEQYRELGKQLRGLCESESNLYANLANTSAVLKEAFNFFWVGFYLKASEDELVLGPFQGPLACTRIKKNKGVCGTAWSEMKTQFVPDVHQYPGHIACSSLSKSEVVVPLKKSNGEFWGVLDVDQTEIDAFDMEDREGLEQIAAILTEITERHEKA
jgi:GAF domain-containing protein